MPQIANLPVFPLQLVLFPNERLPLHIFEERYKELVQYCLDNDSPFGIMLAEDDQVATVGCTAEIDRVIKKYEDGRLDIEVKGVERFEVQEIHQDHAYLSADVELLPEGTPAVDPTLRERVITQHMRLLELAGRTVRPSLYEDTEQLSYVIASNAGLSVEQQQALLIIDRENERLQFLVEHLEEMIPRVEQVESVQKKIRSNGHFKDFPPEDLPPDIDA
jgi:Lon protease-like protein